MHFTLMDNSTESSSDYDNALLLVNSIDEYVIIIGGIFMLSMIALSLANLIKTKRRERFEVTIVLFMTIKYITWATHPLLVVIQD